MKHSDIATLAFETAMAAWGHISDETPRPFPGNTTYLDLYSYARDRSFPPPETLARKTAEMIGERFSFATLHHAPKGIGAFFQVFRAVAVALEPFHEPDPEEDHAPGAAPAKDDPAGAGGTEADTQTQEPDDGNGTGGETPPAADPKAGKPTAAPSDQPDEAGGDTAADAGGKDAQGETEETKVTGDKAAGAAKKDDKK
ncbi:hypothetical protein NA8A_04773 [Nitratireductor indicus C115]|uniref:Uncharacterized protein n=1 Tax=Nitratireductor indicus C115 TaxID=1231190 RepID=K2P7V4_9HYPH|nr:hypothetical protein [Nitratireductor indicus]EKF43316.1 hypothetical protein NA8A_04773 [Nitratireductor indicus C115]SFQ10232.1 hypothetical protein SAMN05216176_101351 [Nitratireductor indicus]